MNRIRLAEIRYRDKVNKGGKEKRKDTKKHRKQINKVRKYEKSYEENNHQQLQKTKKTTKFQRKKQCELNKRTVLFRKQNESIKEIKQIEGKEKTENIIDEDFDLG